MRLKDEHVRNEPFRIDNNDWRGYIRFQYNACSLRHEVFCVRQDLKKRSKG